MVTKRNGITHHKPVKGTHTIQCASLTRINKQQILIQCQAQVS